MGTLKAGFKREETEAHRRERLMRNGHVEFALLWLEGLWSKELAGLTRKLSIHHSRLRELSPVEYGQIVREIRDLKAGLAKLKDRFPYYSPAPRKVAKSCPLKEKVRFLEVYSQPLDRETVAYHIDEVRLELSRTPDGRLELLEIDDPKEQVA